MVDETIGAAAITYHRQPRPGKVEVLATKPLGNQRDLALAYTPGVAAACRAIAEDPSQASELTARANLVAVVTNGTAVLGLGAIGPLASTGRNWAWRPIPSSARAPASSDPSSTGESSRPLGPALRRAAFLGGDHEPLWPGQSRT